MMTFKDILREDKELIEKHLEELLNVDLIYQKDILDSMRYSIKTGGKRLRPILFIETVKLLGKNPLDFIVYPCAIEMIHTYSLIHDDLPAMDDDSLRRGKPTNHIVFGEGLAILAGDALLNYAFEILFKDIKKNIEPNRASAAYDIAKASGFFGMIGGQVVDLESEGKEVDIETMEFIHRHKTGALIETSMVSAAILCDAKPEEIEALKKYARAIGLNFQITDDILDITGDEKILGKTIGSDLENNKATYPKFYGLEETKNLSRKIRDESINYLKVFDEDKANFFKELSNYILERKS